MAWWVLKLHQFCAHIAHIADRPKQRITAALMRGPWDGRGGWQFETQSKPFSTRLRLSQSPLVERQT